MPLTILEYWYLMKASTVKLYWVPCLVGKAHIGIIFMLILILILLISVENKLHNISALTSCGR